MGALTFALGVAIGVVSAISYFCMKSCMEKDDLLELLLHRLEDEGRGMPRGKLLYLLSLAREITTWGIVIGALCAVLGATMLM